MDLENNEEHAFRESFGDFIRRHREASGKTIEGISRTTRIPRRYLEAFESNDQAKLPEDAFARGFLRSFAQEIGLEIEDCLQRYDRFRRSLMPTQIKEVKKPAKYILLGESVEPSSSQRWLKITLMAGAALTALIFVLIWILSPSSSSKVVSDAQNTAESTESSAEKSASSPALTPDSTHTEQSVGGQTVSGQTAAVAPKPQPLALPATPSVLTIKALRDAKLSIRLDENAVQEILMKQGDAQTLNVFREIEIRTTDKTALQFQYNGQPLEVAGPVLKLFNRNLFDKKR